MELKQLQSWLAHHRKSARVVLIFCSGVVHKLNERLASQGKRVAERAAIDIIQQVTDGYGKPEDHV